MSHELWLCRGGNSGKIVTAMLKRIYVSILLLVSALPVFGETLEISAMEWARPRHGEWLLQQPALVAAMTQLQQTPASRLQIRHPGGDAGLLWAEELHSWLVALGLESERIERFPGSGEADRIELRVIQ